MGDVQRQMTIRLNNVDRLLGQLHAAERLLSEIRCFVDDLEFFEPSPQSQERFELVTQIIRWNQEWSELEKLFTED